MRSRRGRRCTICGHEQRAEIEQAVAEGLESQGSIAARFGLTPRMVQYHTARHIPLAMAAAAAERAARHEEAGAVPAPTPTPAPSAPTASEGERQPVELWHGERLLMHTQGLYVRAARILNAAEHSEKYGLALSAIREARECLTLLARMAGELNDGTQVNVALIQSPEWEAVRAALLRALEPFADARMAAARALLTLEAGGRDVGG